MTVKSVCGVILATDDPERLAGFYARALGLEFEREEHGDLAVHFGADIGTVHFGIHPPENLGQPASGQHAGRIAFEVESLADAVESIRRAGGREIEPPHDEGFGPVAAFEDPDGNGFEVVELRYSFGDET